MQGNLIGDKLPDYLKIKSTVAFVLKEFPEARNDDFILIEKVTGIFIKLNLKKPSYETITRCRRKLNEQGLYLPDSETANKRKEKEQFFRSAAKEGVL